MPVFRAVDLVSRLPNRQLQGANWRKSPATPANIPVLQRLSAETGFDHDCRPVAGVHLGMFSALNLSRLGIPFTDSDPPA
jgi:hypothetical protein